ncbi:nitrate transporter [Trifolium pratense]|uniref:Nitrate transporter n=1 Tax=Trifolium pratense TaxID=57577 RepID=A0A2K3L6X6_TRIPR|nr:nitrate transporter [Trifolium pratense]
MLTAWVPELHPTPCSIQQQQSGICNDHTDFQLRVLIFGLFWLSIGTGGIRPCSIPFAVDQFDLTTSEGRHGSSRFYNLYYTTQTLVMLINQTLLVYIEDSVSWTLGYGLFTLFMLIAIIVFFAGTRVYSYVQPEGSILSTIAQVLVAARHKQHLHLPSYVQPEGSILSTIAQVLVAARHKQHLHLPSSGDTKGVFYDPTLQNESEEKLPLTKEFRCLNKAALVVEENELNGDGSSKDPWRLCSIQQIEELKYIGNFEIHAGSVSVITLIAIVLVAGLVEKRRRELAISTLDSKGVAPMSVMWLAPQFLLIAFCHIFGTVGYTEFFNKESPNSMRSISNSLLCLNLSVGSNLSTFIVNIVHSYTGKQGEVDWLDSDINKGRLEYFYFIIAGLAVLNLCYFIFCARRYRYKATSLKG